MKTHPAHLLSVFPDLLACFTTRLGGVSRPPYTSANLAFHVGDEAADVLSNHDLLAAALGYERSRLVHMRQIHSDRIVIVDGTSGFDTPPECDALITDLPRTPLMVMSADCTPLLLYDPRTRSIGAVHAGRAGALKKILPKTIEAMEACCYEINPAIAQEVADAGYASALRRGGEGIFLDVNAILLAQLKEAGIDPEKIEASGACTSCERDKYFSYRADAQKTGRIAGVIMLR